VREMARKYVAEIFEQRGPDVFVLLKRKKVAVGKTEFSYRGHTFVIPDRVQTVWYNSTNPILTYVFDRTLPRETTIRPVEKLPKQPAGGKDPTSLSTDLLFRRKALQQIINATKGADFKQLLPYFVIALAMGLALGFSIFQVYHPGLVQAPPPGYTYSLTPVHPPATGAGGS
jgi:hypothetical protein